MRFIISLITVLSCSSAWAHSKKIDVVVSFSILQDLVQKVGGDKVSVVSLVGYDQDAHVYEPTPAALKNIKSSQIVVSNGLGMEGWMSRLIKSSGFKGINCVATAGIQSKDPHAWQSLKNIPVYLSNIEKALSQASPGDAEFFKSNRLNYEKEISELAEWAKLQFAEIPVQKRKILTSHDAFQFFARDFELTILSPQGWTTESDPTAKVMADLIRQIKKSDIRALFLENMTNPKITQQIAKESGVSVGGVLYADSLSKKADSFVAMYRHNVEEVAKALKK
ncbi:MAG: metal ABC transporter solute-binding protein, Zn/Mn family [Pseudobdellovibrionaceae bacterium]